MKTLKLNQLEKSEMNEVRGGAPVCDGACYVCTAPVIHDNERGGTYGRKKDDKARSYQWQTGFQWNGNVQPPKSTKL